MRRWVVIVLSSEVVITYRLQKLLFLDAAQRGTSYLKHQMASTSRSKSKIRFAARCVSMSIPVNDVLSRGSANAGTRVWRSPICAKGLFEKMSDDDII